MQTKAILFDFGGTIDTNGVHWSEKFWDTYKRCEIPIDKKDFEAAYVSTERLLGRENRIKPEMSFYEIIREKLIIQIYFLIQQGKLSHLTIVDDLSKKLADDCYASIKSAVAVANETMEKLKKEYTIGVVSNFYGNIDKVLEEFDIHNLCKIIVDSTIVGIRKPDPDIYKLAIDKLGLLAEEVAIVGDSYTNDMEPGRKLGSKTVWLKGRSWKEETQSEAADHIIGHFKELENIFL